MQFFLIQKCLKKTLISEQKTDITIHGNSPFQNILKEV